MSDLLNDHRSREQLDAALTDIQGAPADSGAVELIVRRPRDNAREVLASCELSCNEGVVGDNWSRKPFRKSPDGGPHPDMQINIMNARSIRAIAGDDKTAWPPAGDQFFVNLDLSDANLPPGTRLQIGTAVLEVTAEPHLGCKKFTERFGRDAMEFVNSELGKSLNLRGINAKVVTPGSVSTGDTISKL